MDVVCPSQSVTGTDASKFNATPAAALAPPPICEQQINQAMLQIKLDQLQQQQQIYQQLLQQKLHDEQQRQLHASAQMHLFAHQSSVNMAGMMNTIYPYSSIPAIQLIPQARAVGVEPQQLTRMA